MESLIFFLNIFKVKNSIQWFHNGDNTFPQMYYLHLVRLIVTEINL